MLEKGQQVVIKFTLVPKAQQTPGINPKMMALENTIGEVIEIHKPHLLRVKDINGGTWLYHVDWLTPVQQRFQIQATRRV